jgi:hypothetical protein
MKKIVYALVFIAAGMLFANSASAVETKVEGRIYATWWMYLNDTVFVNNNGVATNQKGWNQFALDRSYMSLKSKLTDYTSVTITSDLRTGIYAGYTMILKYGYANVKMPFLTPLSISLGLQPTKFLDYIDNQFWGHRYIVQSVADLTGILTTSDLGATADYLLGGGGSYGSVGLSIWNGTKYSDLNELNKNKDINIYAAVKPLVNNTKFDRTIVAAQAYLGTRNVVIDTSMKASDYKRQIYSFAGKFNYGNYIDLGVEYWMNKLGQGAGTDDLKQSAFSLYSMIYLKPYVSDKSALRTLDFLVLYDMFDPNTKSDTVKDNQHMLIVGLECAPVKGIEATINYRSLGYENSKIKSQNYIYLNTEFRF